MKQLFFKSSFLFLLCFFSNSILADDLTINGKVSATIDEIAVPGFPVNISSVDGNYVVDAITDDEGNYTATIDLPAGTVTDFTVEVLDICFGEIISQTVSSSAGIIEINFLLCDDLVVDPVGCVPAFSYAPGVIDPIGYPIDFTDNSIGNIDSWSWNFGDGNTSSDQNPTHIYEDEGSYVVSLEISGDSCDNVLEQVVIVGDNGVDPCNCFLDFTPVCVIDSLTGDQLIFPNACFAICEGYTESDFVNCDFGGGNNGDCFAGFDFSQDATDASIVNFTDQSSENATSWSWDFGDGNTSNDQNPSHDYQDFGIYTVNLTISTDSCSASYSELLCIYENGNGGGGLDSCDCPLIFIPVCVTDSAGVLLTFPNACFAECEGYTADDIEDCGNGGDPCDCSAVFGPTVCVVDSTGAILNFMNACFAICEGYTPDDFVECGNGGDPCDNCPDYYDPVCVADSAGVIITFDNACFAICAGYGPDSFVSCGNGGDPCDNCPTYYDPVCVVDSTGDVISFENACFAICAGYGPDSFVSCNGGDPCDNCPEYYDPVCVVDSTGVTITFDNVCFAICAGYGPDSFVNCNGGDPCDDCPEYYDPVCVVDSTGTVITFDNACFAICAGYGPDSFVNCGNGGDPCDDCPDYYDPVCVLDADGNIITFENACYAICEGFEFSDFVNCNTDPDPCNCTFDFDPVCVLDSLTGDELTFPNACFAECLGFEETDFIECSDTQWPDCNCPFEIDPVCVLDADGNVQTFLNACFAECEGYTADDLEDDCGIDPDTLDCGCDISFDPVCTTDDNGELLVFLNTCWAQCAGIDPSDLSDCDLDGNNLMGGTIYALMGAAPLNTNSALSLLNNIFAYPNPVETQLNIELTTEESLELSISLISLTGKEIYTSRVISNKGKNTLEVPVANLTEGIYFARIKAKDEVISLKFVK